MKKNHIIMLIAFIIGVVVILGGVYFLRPKNRDMSFISPNGQKVIIASTYVDSADSSKNGNIKFTIQERSSGKTVGEIITNASSRLNWSVRWINDTKIELNSSDTGTYCWEEQENDKWVEGSC